MEGRVNVHAPRASTLRAGDNLVDFASKLELERWYIRVE